MTTTNRYLASLVVALCLLAAGIAPSAAQGLGEPGADPFATNALQVSLDGVTWSESITTPLFDPDIRWVPGDVRTARFFVRNSMPDLGDLTVVLERPLARALFDSGFLEIAARAGNGAWSEIEAGDRRVLVDDAPVDSRDELGVQLRATMDADAPNGTMVLATDLDLQIRLTQGGVVADATSDDNGPKGFSAGGDPTNPGGPTAVATASGALPDTGSPLRPWVLPLALLLLGSGAVLMARRRHGDDDEVAAASCSDLENSSAQP